LTLFPALNRKKERKKERQKARQAERAEGKTRELAVNDLKKNAQ
jgi:hypothetical protein